VSMAAGCCGRLVALLEVFRHHGWRLRCCFRGHDLEAQYYVAKDTSSLDHGGKNCLVFGMGKGLYRRLF